MSSSSVSAFCVSVSNPRVSARRLAAGIAGALSHCEALAGEPVATWSSWSVGGADLAAAIVAAVVLAPPLRAGGLRVLAADLLALGFHAVAHHERREWHRGAVAAAGGDTGHAATART